VKQLPPPGFWSTQILPHLLRPPGGRRSIPGLNRVACRKNGHLAEAIENDFPVGFRNARPSVAHVNGEHVSHGWFSRQHDLPTSWVNLIALSTRLESTRKILFWSARTVGVASVISFCSIMPYSRACGMNSLKTVPASLRRSTHQRKVQPASLRAGNVIMESIRLSRRWCYPGDFHRLVGRSSSSLVFLVEFSQYIQGA